MERKSTFPWWIETIEPDHLRGIYVLLERRSWFIGTTMRTDIIVQEASSVCRPRFRYIITYYMRTECTLDQIRFLMGQSVYHTILSLALKAVHIVGKVKMDVHRHGTSNLSQAWAKVKIKDLWDLQRERKNRWLETIPLYLIVFQILRHHSRIRNTTLVQTILTPACQIPYYTVVGVKWLLHMPGSIFRVHVPNTMFHIYPPFFSTLFITFHPLFPSLSLFHASCSTLALQTVVDWYDKCS